MSQYFDTLFVCRVYQNFEAVDKVAPQWLFMAMFNSLNKIYIIKEPKYL